VVTREDLLEAIAGDMPDSGLALPIYSSEGKP
jgi:hypothetical protein